MVIYLATTKHYRPLCHLSGKLLHRTLVAIHYIHTVIHNSCGNTVCSALVLYQPERKVLISFQESCHKGACAWDDHIGPQPKSVMQAKSLWIREDKGDILEDTDCHIAISPTN